LLSRLTALCFSAALFLASPVGSRAQFETRGTSLVRSNPLSLGVADFNNDGKPDIAVANYDGQVAVLFGAGTGTFQAPVYLTPSFYGSIIAADFNHDGNIDIALANGLSNEITVLLGNGDGTFQPPQSAPTTAFPTFIATGDFNNDGNLDLIMCDSPYVSVLLGSGDGTFQSPIDTNVSFCSQASGSVVAVGDFNSDGNLDTAVVSNELDILLGNGDGTFQLTAQYSAGEFDQSLTVADFNNDHKPDIAVTNGSGYQIYIFLNNGDGTFRSEAPFAANGPGAITAADLNGDGNQDLIFLTAAAPFPANAITVMLGKGNGKFGSAINFQQLKEGSFVTVGDFNGDHKLDLVATDYLGNAIDVLLNTGVVSYSPTTPLTFQPQTIGTSSSPQSVIFTNTGTQTLAISGMRVTGPFQLSTDTTCGSSVAPGAKCTLSVVFTPKVIGTTGGLLSLSDSASSKPQVIELSGVGTVISLSPTSLNFGTQKVGTKSSPQSVTVTNTGSTTVSVTSVTITGANSKDYSQTNTCGKQIGPGGTCTISVTFAPTKTGTRTALVRINDNGGGGSQGASLTGVGD